MVCECDDWKKVSLEHKDLFKKHPSYGNIIAWIELSDEGNHHKIHNYGIAIQYCPFCSKRVNV